jgi:hypothetical protein
MHWKVFYQEEFFLEYSSLAAEVQDELNAQARWIERFGPQTGRPRVDTLKGSGYPNMKELRFQAADGIWRVAFAFDPNRKAILLVAGDKSGVGEKKFYKSLIDKADSRYERHLNRIGQVGYRLQEVKGDRQ